MLYSPLSIKYALKMFEEGAANNTFDEINKLIGNAQLSKYTNIDKVLSLANGLFIRDTFYKYINSKYINTLKENYDAEVVKDAFVSAADANKWIEDKTFNIIEFTEEEIKAAAVTVFAMKSTSAANPRIPKPLIITLNKPFMFIIRDKKTQNIWFTGTVFEPNKWEDDKKEYIMGH